MYFDSLTTAAVADELREKVLGGRVQRVVQVDPLSLGLEIFAHGTRRQLLASAQAQHPRLYLVDYKVRRGVETVTPLLLMARKHLEGARLVEVEQPPFERLLRLGFAGAQGKVVLLMELIERRANLILLRGDRILDAAQRVRPDMNRYRTIMPGQAYTYPPPQRKLDPTDVTEFQLRQLLKANPDRPLWRVLVDGIAGISPLFARELVFRATGRTQTRAQQCDRVTPLLDTFEEALIPYWEHDWQANVIRDKEGQVTAFAPYPPTHLGRPEPAQSISQALGLYYTPLLGTEAYQAAKAPLEKAIKKARKRIGRKRDSLARQVPNPAALEKIRQKAELVLAYAATIEPGQTELQAQYDPAGPPLKIVLNPKRSPVENAQALFKDYEKRKRATANVPQRLATADLEMSYLEQLATDLALAENWPDIDEVRESLQAAGFLSQAPLTRPRGSASAPLRVVSDDGLVIFVGRNSRQNEMVTFKRAAPNDLWLHAQGVPGGHVIIKSGGRPVPDRTLRQAAQLAAGYSAARDELDVPVDVVERKRVRRVKGSQAKPGLVTHTGAETLRVVPKTQDQ